MADTGPSNPGQQPTNTPSNMGLSQDAQFRTLSARIDALTDELSKQAKPTAFRLADYIQLAVIVVGFVVALFTAFGLSSRLDDLRGTQTATESRVSAQITAAEVRITTRLDKLNDQFIRINERTSTIEGQQQRGRK